MAATAHAGERTGALLAGTPGRPFATLNVPDGDAERIELRGTLASFAARGIPVDPVFPGPIALENALHVDAADGHSWMVWGEKPLAMYASRPRTTAERERWIDIRNAMVSSSYFSVDRQVMCNRIGMELERLLDILCEPRKKGERALLRRKLSTLSPVLCALTTNPKADMAIMRDWLDGIGVKVPQVDYLNR
jgi:hypothetical protein